MPAFSGAKNRREQREKGLRLASASRLSRLDILRNVTATLAVHVCSVDPAVPRSVLLW